jgi:hypothetical protein
MDYGYNAVHDRTYERFGASGSAGDGFEYDKMRPNAWRYRDYVIEAFNRDKPFDRFILEQIAGDELPDASAETFTALGYHRLGPWDDEPADPKEDRFDQLDDMVSTTAQVFLGMTLGCARCHNHKFDPIAQKDYYKMLATVPGDKAFPTAADSGSIASTGRRWRSNSAKRAGSWASTISRASSRSLSPIFRRAFFLGSIFASFGGATRLSELQFPSESLSRPTPSPSFVLC